MLNKNLQNTNSKTYNQALSNNNLEKLFTLTLWSNSSLIKFGEGLKEYKVECTTLDSLNLKK